MTDITLFKPKQRLTQEILDEFARDVLMWNVVAGNSDAATEDLNGMLTLYQNLFAEESKEYITAIDDKDKVGVLDGICDCYVVGIYLATLLASIQSPQANIVKSMISEKMYLYDLMNIDIIGAFKEVMRSNWSKFPIVEDIEDVVAECAWIENNRAQVGVTASTVETDNGTFYVFKNVSGKVVKPSTFTEPMLDTFIP